MSTVHENIVDQLEEILEKNRDAEKGYAKAAENAKSSGLKSYFQRKSSERKDFNASLKSKMVTAYDEIDDGGSFTGTIHRTWMDVKALFSADNDEAMLEEAIKGDKAAVEEYGEILEEGNLPVDIAECLVEQKVKIQKDLVEINKLENLS
ncbi:MAG: PA2169 family four-helix-bundle protein [Maribacter sp.]